MRVSLSELKPGYVLTDNVLGKSGRPIMLKYTVLTEKHIQILKKFLIKAVHISTRSPNSKPKKTSISDVLSKSASPLDDNQEATTSFVNHYLDVVQEHKKQFKKWKNNLPIDMPKLRKIFLPLLDHFEDEKINIFALSKYAAKSNNINYHSVFLGLMSAYIAKQMNLEKREWLQVGLAGLLSDCGLAKIEDKIINKPSLLNRREMDILHEHPRQSYFLIKSIPTLSKTVQLAILQHHERLDGSGYPVGLTGNKIHLYARIIAVCDMYYTNVSHLFTKGDISPFDAIKEVKQAQYNGLDPKIVYRFVREFTKNVLGLRVRLSNQKIGQIIFVNEEKPDQPIVKLEDGQEIIPLESEEELFIKEIIYPL